MSTNELIAELRERGVLLEVSGDRLRVNAPKGTITAQLREALASHKAEVLSVLRYTDREIAWRVGAMLPQIPEVGPIPFLVARADIEREPSQCHSCGEELDILNGFVCSFCSRAKNLALEKAMRRI